MRWELLASLDPEDRAHFLERARPRRYARHEVIFHEGDAGDSLHLIQEGRVAIKVVTPDGSTATLSVLGQGEAFGEMALLRRSSQRTASAIALEPVTTLTVHKDVFKALRAERPHVERMLIAVLAGRTDRLTRHLIEALYSPVQTRIVRRLHETAQLYDEGTVPITIPLTQDDVAGLAGTTRPTANGVLRELEEAGVIALHRGGLDILDVPALAKLAR